MGAGSSAGETSTRGTLRDTRYNKSYLEIITEEELSINEFEESYASILEERKSQDLLPELDQAILSDESHNVLTSFLHLYATNKDNFDKKLVQHLLGIIDINTTDKDNNTALHKAYEVKNETFSELVLQSVTDINWNIKNHKGKSITDIANRNKANGEEILKIISQNNNSAAEEGPSSSANPINFSSPYKDDGRNI